MKTDTKRARGLYGEHHVERTDGRDGDGDKHDGCRYFVLDLDHDPHAVPALQAYADAARDDGYEALADDSTRSSTRQPPPAGRPHHRPATPPDELSPHEA